MVQMSRARLCVEIGAYWCLVMTIQHMFHSTMGLSWEGFLVTVSLLIWLGAFTLHAFYFRRTDEPPFPSFLFACLTSTMLCIFGSPFFHVFLGLIDGSREGEVRYRSVLLLLAASLSLYMMFRRILSTGRCDLSDAQTEGPLREVQHSHGTRSSSLTVASFRTWRGSRDFAARD